jgi:transposase
MAKDSLSSLQKFVIGFEHEPFWVGLDVHKRNDYVALRRSDGQHTTWVATASSTTLTKQLLQLNIKIVSVSYETGPTGFTLARALESAGFRVIVAAASRIPRSVTAGAKCDRLDCLKLADYAAKGMLKPIAMPTPDEEARRALLRRRHTLVDAVRRSKQRIKSLLLFLGLEEPQEVTQWNQGVPKAIFELPLEPASRLTLESYLRELTFHQTELRRVEGELKQLVASTKQRRRIGYLQTVPGVGPTVSTTFALELFSPERFHRAEEVASYLGLAPMVHHSGGKTPRGRLVPVGQKRLRSLLIEAAWMWKSKDPFAAALYNRLLARSGIAQKAIAAVARKLAIILWRLLVEQRPYRIGTI